MTSLILMYVFYDKNGDIKAITPMLDESLSATHSSATFPLQEVEMFLNAERNTFDYYIKKVEKISGTTYKLVKKKSEIVYTRTLDSYLTKVEDSVHGYDIITITNITEDRCISVQLNKEFKDIFNREAGSDEQLETMSDFFNRGPSMVYLTERNNPYRLYFSFAFTPRDLLTTDKLYFKYDGNYNDASAYTKKLIRGYGYIER